MSNVMRQKRIDLLKARLRVAFDLLIGFGLVIGTVLLTVATVTATAPFILYVLLTAFLNIAVIVFVGYYFVKRASSW